MKRLAFAIIVLVILIAPLPLGAERLKIIGIDANNKVVATVKLGKVTLRQAVQIAAELSKDARIVYLVCKKGFWHDAYYAPDPIGAVHKRHGPAKNRDKPEKTDAMAGGPPPA